MGALENEFGTIPWDLGLVRVATKATTLQAKVQRQLSLENQVLRVAVQIPGSQLQVEQTTAMEQLLKSLERVIDPAKVSEGKSLIEKLRGCLRLSSGRRRRDKGGGWQYSEMFMLEAVLFADHLRQVHDGDALADAVRRTLVRLSAFGFFDEVVLVSLMKLFEIG